MARYVALLGSINVGGNRLKMADLVAALERQGFENVATVVASGNVLFDHAQAADSKLEARIAEIVKREFGIDSVVAVRSRAELAASIGDNPFDGENEDKFVHTLFVVDEALDRGVLDDFARDYDGPERLAAAERTLFVDFGSSVADSRLGQKMKPLELRTTARNIRSLRRILEKMDA